MSKTRAAKLFIGFGKVVAGLLLLGILAIATLLIALRIDHTRETELPTPTGPFVVGRTTLLWSDDAQQELMAPLPGMKRVVVAWVWYPASPQPAASSTAEYLPGPWLSAVEKQRGTLIKKFLTRDFSRVRTHSYEDAQVSPQVAKYPVVLIRAGLSGLVTGYTALAEDLASHGYVVVGIDAPYRSSVVVLPDGRVIARAPEDNADLLGGSAQEQLAVKLVNAWSSDMSFALDKLAWLNGNDLAGRFTGRLDLQRVGVLGHSLGGATALQFCHDDARCKVGVDLDGAPIGPVVEQGVAQPFMFLLSESGQGGDTDAEGRRVIDNIRSIYDRLPSDRRLWITIHGANHFVFSDDGAFLKSPLVRRVLRAGGLMGLDGRRQIGLTAECIDTFFDVYLKDAPATKLNALQTYPEIEPVR